MAKIPHISHNANKKDIVQAINELGVLLQQRVSSAGVSAGLQIRLVPGQKFYLNSPTNTSYWIMTTDDVFELWILGVRKWRGGVT